MTSTVARKYALTKIEPGDYLLPSNDATRLYRIRKYTDGPSFGLDWDRDRTLWGVWRWHHSLAHMEYTTPDPDDWTQWEHCEDGFLTRTEAIDEAIGVTP